MVLKRLLRIVVVESFQILFTLKCLEGSQLTGVRNDLLLSGVRPRAILIVAASP
jgi:hypothetical protein